VALEPAATEFPVAPCARCAKDVLCYFELGKHDAEVVRCVDCDTPAEATVVRWLDLHRLEELGYGFVLPAGGCGRPGCGEGRCGRSA
jgi:hypothetical protein